MQKLLALMVSLMLVLCLASCGDVKQPDFKSVENVRLSEFGLRETTLMLEILYYNPNPFRVKLREAEGDAWLDSNYLGHFFIDTLIKIQPNTDFRLPVTLKMDMAHFLQNTSAIFSNKEVLVKIEGKARLGKGLIYLRYPIHYEGKQNLGSAIQ